MNPLLKRILIIIGFVALVVLIAWALFYLFFRSPEADQPNQPGVTPNQQTGQTNQLPNIGTGQPGSSQVDDNGNRLVSQISDDQPISRVAQGGLTQVNTILEQSYDGLKLSSDGDLKYFNLQDGRFYRLTSDGELTKLSDQRFFGIEDIVWSEDSNKAIIEYPDGSNIVYDFITDRQTTLPKEFEDFDFSKNGSQIAAEAIGQNENSNWIVTINSDGSNLTLIAPIGDQADNVDINISPNNQVVALYAKNTSVDSQEVQLVGKNEENFPSITTYGRGFSGQWTPDGQQLLYSVYSLKDDLKPRLWLVDASGENIGYNNEDLGLQTWSEKCVINSDSTTAYCAVPNNLPAASGPYPEVGYEYDDSFYQVDLQTGQTRFLADPVGEADGYSAQNLFLNGDGSALYFQDAKTGLVYSINLE